MRNLWREFKSFAVSGSVLDLALGFLIGAAFAGLVQSLANNVLMQLAAAIFRKRDFSALHVTVNRAEIRYGAFLTDLLNFVILAVIMFAVVKLVVRVGIAQARSFGDAQCPYCYESIPPKALTCKACGQKLVDELPSPQAARQRQAELQPKRGLTIPTRRPR